MALTTAQQALINFKASQGVANTNDTRQYYEEPLPGRPIVLPSQVWNQASLIPSTAPTGMTDGQTIGVVTRCLTRSMTAVTGTTNAFYLAALVNSIPFNYADGTYNVALTDSAGTAIAFGTDDWVINAAAGTVTFENSVPANMPPKISFFGYAGTFGVGSGSGGGGGNLNSNPNGASGVADWTGINNQIGVSVLSTTFLSAPGYSSNFTLNQNDPVQFFATGGTIISPLVAGTTYYANVSSGALTNVSATPGGTAISGYTAGSGSTYLFQARPNSINPSYAPNTQTDFAISALSPSGSGFLLSKGTGTDMGFNLEKPVTLASPWDLLKPLVVSIDYDTATANTYAAGSLTFWLQEISTSNVVQLATMIPAANTKGTVYQQVALPSSYFSTVALKLIARWTTTSTTAQSLRLGNVSYQTLYTNPVAVLQTNPDSAVELNTGNGFGSTNTAVRRFANLNLSVGSAISYADSATAGASFTILEAGEYSMSYTDATTSGGSAQIAFSKNATGFADATNLANDFCITSGTACCAVTAQLAVGDVIRPVNNGTTLASGATGCRFSISKQGGIKAINAVLNQTMTLPTSEVTFQGSNAKGTTDTGVIGFLAMTNLRGDAFTITNNAANGLIIQVNRSGLISISGSIGITGSNAIFLTRNQAVLTGTGAGTECLTSATASATGYAGSYAWSGKCFAGDKFRVTGTSAPTNNGYNFVTALFDDDSIPIALNTVQPIWSQSDSESRVTSANGVGSTATAIRRFSNIEASLGSDVTYADSATNGASWTINTVGLYTIAYCENFISAQYFSITRNQATLTNTPTSNSITETLVLGTTPLANYSEVITWMGQLQVGDIIRPCIGGGSPSGALQSFTIAKQGKPNLTAVDVTPFVQYQQQVTEYIEALTLTSTFGSTNTGVPVLSVTRNSNLGVISISSDSVNGTSFKALQACEMKIMASGSVAAAGSLYITRNATLLTTTNPDGAINYSGSSTIAFTAEVSASLSLVAGDVIRIQRNSTGISNIPAVTITAVAQTNAIQGPTNLTSSDTMTFAFKSTAIATTDPIGTFNTYQYNTTSSQTATLSVTAPTQTTASMNANGFNVFARGFTSTSTAASPARVDIFIGTGLKSVVTTAYGGTSKTLSFGYDRIFNGAATEYGTSIFYNELTGILTIDGGVSVSSAANRWLDASASGTYSNGYFVVNAGKLPAIASVLTVNAQKLYNAPYAANVNFQSSYAGNRLALTGNVASSTIPSGFDGQQIMMIFVQDATGSRTFVWPTNTVGGITIGATASKRSQQMFTYSALDGLWIAQDIGITNI